MAMPLALGACELIAGVDRSQIEQNNPNDGSGGESDADGGEAPTAGGGAQSAGGNTSTGGGSQSIGGSSTTAGGGAQSTGGGSQAAAGDTSTGGTAGDGGASGSGGDPDLAGAGGEPSGPITPLGKIIYLTATPKKANFGGISGADAQCNANPPKAGTYKALLVDGTTRVACASANCTTNGAAEGTDWALAASTKYVRADGTTVIGTTTGAAVFAFPLTASIGTSGFSYWTGLRADWTTSADTCTGWTEVSSVFASEGLADASDGQAIEGVSESCSTLAGAFFACVEQ